MSKTNEMNELKTLLLLNKDEILSRAMAASENNALMAIERVDISLKYIIKIYPKLANKKYTLDFLYDKIAECTPNGDKLYNTDKDIGEFIESIIDASLKSKKRFSTSILASACAVIVIAASVLTVISIPKAVDPIETVATDENGNVIEVPTGPVIMDKTRRFDGQNGVLEIINYQRFYDTIDKKGEFVNHTDVYLPINTMSSVLTTKEDETYMVFQNFEKEDGSNTTFNLYHLEKDGWKTLASGDVSHGFLSGFATFWASPIYLIADTESNLHTVALLDDMIVIYDYDKENDVFIKNVSPYKFGKIGTSAFFSANYDEKDGEAGAIYVAGVFNNTYTFLKYDVKEKTFEVSSKLSFGTTFGHNFKFTAADGVIYLLAQAGSGSDAKLCLFTINDAFGTERSYKRTVLFDVKTFMKENPNVVDVSSLVGRVVGTTNEGIYIDDDGVIHIIAEKNIRQLPDDLLFKTTLIYYKIDSDGNVFSKELERLYDSEDIKNNVFAGFITIDGERYYAELYDGALNTIAIGKITDDGKAELVDVFELTNNFNRNGFSTKINGPNVQFISMENSNIYFFQIKGK